MVIKLIVATLKAKKKTGPWHKSMFGCRRAEMLKSPPQKNDFKEFTENFKLRFHSSRAAEIWFSSLCTWCRWSASICRHSSTTSTRRCPRRWFLQIHLDPRGVESPAADERVFVKVCQRSVFTPSYPTHTPPHTSTHLHTPPSPPPQCYCICSTEETHKHNRAVC